MAAWASVNRPPTTPTFSASRLTLPTRMPRCCLIAEKENVIPKSSTEAFPKREMVRPAAYYPADDGWWDERSKFGIRVASRTDSFSSVVWETKLPTVWQRMWTIVRWS